MTDQTQEQAKEPDWDRIKKFHSHLDVCSQCRNHPFGLCATGAKLLKYAATGVMDKSNEAIIRTQDNI